MTETRGLIAIWGVAAEPCVFGTSICFLAVIHPALSSAAMEITRARVWILISRMNVAFCQECIQAKFNVRGQ